MQWLIIARDGTDPEAPERRQVTRQAHLEHAARLQADPYVTGGVWRTIEVIPCRVAPHYQFRPALPLAETRPSALFGRVVILCQPG